ncbi:Glycoside hydrolase family 76 protein [Mycena venus]|uniref:Glycoside hydrolase family 76 protein n=1 Tax=Mycena venus TaxID=2733690 RepID=A0A8H6YRH9_9AGAR|nr:Glycoside hydrolase family 76 protein [Mycena venus]
MHEDGLISLTGDWKPHIHSRPLTFQVTSLMLPLLSLVVSFQLLVLCRGGQLVSSSWRRPNVTISLEDRINIAGMAIETAMSKLGPDAQFDGHPSRHAGHLYSQMAKFDIVSNQTKYRDT